MPKVYRFTIYDIKNDESVLSRRWATREAIAWAHGHAIEKTEIEVDASVLDGNGMTERDFDPHALKGFQRQVTR
jgi:phosphopantetheinyl transferase (holo-ACP synthase)